MKLWEFYKYTRASQTSYFLDFPLIIYDVDGDDVQDLLTSCSFIHVKEQMHSDQTYQNYLIIISGKTGRIINNPIRIKLCTGIHNLMFENEYTISYTCYNSTKKGFIKI